MIYRVEGGMPLRGSVKISGCKNAVLPILFATLLTRGTSLLYGVPEITDVETVLSLLRAFGADISRPEPHTVQIDTSHLEYTRPSDDFTRAIRASTYLIGACLGRFGKVGLSTFGGCGFCDRPIDLHLKAVRSFGGEIYENEIICKQLVANRVVFPVVSVGATVNSLLLASQIPEESILENVAIEPHVMSLVTFLRIAGCRISILHTPRPTFFVRGGRLKGVRMKMIPDMIEAGTYLISALINGGEVTVDGIEPSHLSSLFTLLRRAGTDIVVRENSATITCDKPPKPMHIVCEPFPGIPTDLSPILAGALARYGSGTLRDTVFSKRRSFLSPYHSLGANYIEKEDGTLVFLPADPPRTDTLTVPDLRAGAGMLLYALSVGQPVVVEDPSNYILRGYEDFTKKINALGANVSVVTR